MLMNLNIETISALLVLCETTPTMADWSPQQGTSIVEFIFLCC